MGARSLSITHYLSLRCPPALEKSRCTELTERLLGGDLSVIEELITGHMRLAIYLAGQLSYGTPNQVNDLICVALEAMVEGCHLAIKEGVLNNDLTRFFDSRIRTKCTTFLRNDQLVHIPYSTLALKEGILIPKFFPVDNAYIYPHGTEELMEEILSHCHTIEERKVIILRSHYFTDEEIGSQLYLSRDKVIRLRKKVEKRFYASYQN